MKRHNLLRRENSAAEFLDTTRSRCQRTNVPGRTIVSRSRHSISRDSATKAIRDALSVRSDLTFKIAGELLSEEQVLGGQLRTGSEHQRHETPEVNKQGKRIPEHGWR